MARLMSDAEIKRRKRAQGHISQATGALGLTALGGTLLATKKGGKLTQAGFKAAGKERPKALSPKKMGRTTAPILATGAGLSGAGSFNFASYTNAESRKRKQTVKKGLTMDVGYYGEEGHPIELPPIDVPIEKAWSPSASNFDSERGRQKRNKAYEGGTLVAAGAGGAYAAHEGRKALGAGKKVKAREMAPVEHKTNTAGKPYKVAPTAKAEKAIPTKAAAKGLKHAGKATAGLAVVAGAAGLHGTLKRKQQGSWSPYAKRDTTSAWGIDHMSGQHRETEN